MARKKSAAKKHRERTGTYLSKLTFHVPVSDIIDILAVLIRDDPKCESQLTDQNSIVSAVARFLTDQGNDGMKWARRETGSKELVEDQIYNRAAALVEAHLSFMIADQPEAKTEQQDNKTQDKKNNETPQKVDAQGSVNRSKKRVRQRGDDSVTPQGEKWLKKHES